MTYQRWRSQVIEEMCRQGLPRDYLDRLVSEITDHASDLLSASQTSNTDGSLESLLGSPEQLAMLAKLEFTRGTFAGRHPALTFLGGPIVTVFGCFFGTVFLINATTWAVSLLFPNMERNPLSSAEYAIDALHICECVSLFLRFFPFALSIWIFVTLGYRTGTLSWSLVSCGVVAVWAFCFQSMATLQTLPDNRVFIDVDLISIPHLNSTQLAQAFVPLAFGIWLYRRSSKNRSDELAVQELPHL